MIVIHTGILMCHVKDSAERGQVSSKYIGYLILWGSQINQIGP